MRGSSSLLGRRPPARFHPHPERAERASEVGQRELAGAVRSHGLGYRSDALGNRAINELRDRDRAAVVGLGVLQHYAVTVRCATRQRWLKDFSGPPTYPLTDRRFYVSRGWGGYRNGYVAAKTWFAGSIRP